MHDNLLLVYKNNTRGYGSGWVYPRVRVYQQTPTNLLNHAFSDSLMYLLSYLLGSDYNTYNMIHQTHTHTLINRPFLLDLYTRLEQDPNANFWDLLRQ